jgi:hypothetical protein
MKSQFHRVNSSLRFPQQISAHFFFPTYVRATVTIESHAVRNKNHQTPHYEIFFPP